MHVNEHADFFKWIEDKKSILNYIEITSSVKKPKKMTFSDFRNSIHSSILKELKTISEEQAKIAVRFHKTLVPRPLIRYHNVSKLYHQLIFIEQTLLDYIYDQREQLLSNELTLISLYETPNLIPSDIIVKTDIQRMTSDFSETTFCVLALKNKYKVLYHEYMSQYNTIPTLDQRQARLNKIINSVSMKFDTRISFFPPTSLQNSFDHILFTPGSPWLESLDKFIATFKDLKPQNCTKEILKITKSICKTYYISDDKKISIIIGFLFRTIFDEVYPTLPVFHSKELSYDVLKDLRNLTIADIDPPRNYLPSTFKDTDIACDVFRRDPVFKEAIEILEAISFFTNPLDILRGIHFAIITIEKAAGIYSIDKSTLSMLPFEVTFGLLLGCTLGANIPELEMLSSFVNDYAPKIGMASDTEFAYAKLTALSIHLKTLAKEKAPQ